MNIPKYRAWHKQRKIMMPVLEINFDPEHGGVFVEDKDGHYCGCRLNMDLWPWPDIELMQFTGRLDKHQQEVYQGDFVMFEQFLGLVKWDHALGGWRIFHNNYVDLLFDDMAVIGNIWQNSDLLPQEQQS